MLLVLDELMAVKDDIGLLFAKISHHINISVVYLTQKTILKYKQYRALLNCKK